MSSRSANALKVPRKWEPPTLTAWQREALEQGFFDFAVPRFAWIPTSQAAKALHMSVDSVLYLAHIGKLESETKAIKGKREELNISRHSLLVYLASVRNQDPRVRNQMFIDAFHAIPCAKSRREILAVLNAMEARS